MATPDDSKSRNYLAIALSGWTAVLTILLVVGLVQGQKFTSQAVEAALTLGSPPQNVTMPSERLLIHLMGYLLVWGFGAAGITWLNNAISRNMRQSRLYQKQLEGTIVERQQLEFRFNRFFEQALNIHLIAGLDGVIHEANSGWQTILGYSPAELKGTLFLNLVHPDDLPATMAEMDKLGQGIVTFYFENRYRHKNGEYRLLAWSANAAMEEQVVYAVATDITARKQAEESLRFSEELFSRAFHGGPLLMTISKIEDGTYTEVNDNFVRLTGFSREDAIGATSESLGFVTPEDRAMLKQKIGKLGKVDGVELVFKKKSGEPIYCLYFGELITVAGEQRLLSIVEDITERKKLEQEHVQQERLAAVGQLAAGIAHDFNNMLTPIIGFAELLEMQHDLPETSKPKITWIISQAQQAARLTRQILDFSRQTIHDPRPLNLATYLDETLVFVRHTIPESIEIRFTHEPGHHTINADPTQLQQVITNLAVNARDAMPSGGTLTFNLSHFALTPKELLHSKVVVSNRWVRLNVTDTGCGIPQNTLPKIFEPFFTTKEVGRGTGLGLAQIYGIVKQHQGCIDVDSQVGQGTTFSLYFPVINTETAAHHQELAVAPTGQGQTILLAEDEPIVLEVTQAMLETLNYRVLTAVDGEEALSLFRAEAGSVALVLTDAVMPGLDGLGLAAILHTESPGTPVLLMTGYMRTPDTEPGHTRNIAARLNKPLKLNLLAQEIHKALA